MTAGSQFMKCSGLLHVGQFITFAKSTIIIMVWYQTVSRYA